VKPEADGCNGLKYNLTADIIQSIFKTYPAGKTRLFDQGPFFHFFCGIVLQFDKSTWSMFLTS
jgi:hypothetical protein